MAGCAAAVLALYVASMPRTVCLEDDGLFIMSAHVAGVNHPPGYPLFSLLGWVFSLLPFGSPAFAIHLLSAVFGALTCAVVFWLGRALTGSRLGGYAAALGFGVSRELWAQSILAEVYTLNTFLFFVCLALCLSYRLRPERRTLLAAAFCAGLGLAHHWPLFVLSAPAFLLLVWPRRRLVVRALPRALGLLAVGLLPYAFLVIRSLTGPAISFYGPIGSLGDLFYFVSREGYADVDRTATAGLGDQLQFLGFFGAQTLAQLTAAGALLAAAGIAVGWRRWDRQVSAALAVAFLGSSVVLIALLRRDYGYLDRAVFEVYPLISYGVLSLWAAAALAALARHAEGWLGGRRIAEDRAPRQAEGPAAARPGRGGVFGAAAIAALIVAALVSNLPGNWRRDDDWARRYAEAVLGLLEPDAVLFTYGDSDTGPIGYLHRVEGMRPDVTLYNAQGLVFGNRLFPARSSESVRREAVDRFLAKTERPVYHTGKLDHSFGVVDLGLIKKVDRGAEAGEKKLTIRPEVLDYLEQILADDDLDDPWTVDHRNRLLGGLGERLGPVVYLTGKESRDQLARHRRLAERLGETFFGKLGLIDGLTQRGDPEELLAWVKEAEVMVDETVPDQVLARLYFLEGFLYGRQGKAAAAIESFERSVELHPDPENGSVENLLKLYARTGARETYWQVRDRFYGESVRPPAAVRALDPKMR